VEKVRAVGADVGVAYDGDADRAGFVDEKGNKVKLSDDDDEEEEDDTPLPASFWASRFPKAKAAAAKAAAEKAAAAAAAPQGGRSRSRRSRRKTRRSTRGRRR
jgi:hypothetical protein